MKKDKRLKKLSKKIEEFALKQLDNYIKIIKKEGKKLRYIS